MPSDWQIVNPGTSASGLLQELQREVAEGHPLFDRELEVLARRLSQDDVLYRLMDGSGRVAEVHLTWRGSAEKPPVYNLRNFRRLDGSGKWGDPQIETRRTTGEPYGATRSKSSSEEAARKQTLRLKQFLVQIRQDRPLRGGTGAELAQKKFSPYED